MSFHPRIVDNRLDLNDELERSWAERGQVSGDALRARAADASHSSLLRVSTRGGIAIACVALSLLTLAYFAWQFAGRPGL